MPSYSTYLPSLQLLWNHLLTSEVLIGWLLPSSFVSISHKDDTAATYILPARRV